MKCSKCGAEIRTGCIYCPNCGSEAQVVTEINILEEDLLRAMMEDQEEARKKEAEELAEKKRAEELARKRRKQEEKRRKKLIRNIVILLVILGACAAGVFVFFRYRQNHSVDYLMGKAEAAYNRKEYQEALDYLDRTLALDGDYEDALMIEGQIQALLKDDEQAEELFLQVIGQNPQRKEAYEELLKLYEKNGEYEKIMDLKDRVADAEILGLFTGYVVEPPAIDRESGSYSEFFEVKLSTTQRNADIYYTLDGSAPTIQSTKYQEAIEFSEQGSYTLRAICVDEDGNASEEAQAEYEIQLNAPDAPQVSPDSGQFTEPVSISVTVPAGTTVYYTWDGGVPDEHSSRYTGPIAVPEGNNILSLIAVDEYGMQSEVLKCNYIYYPQ